MKKILITGGLGQIGSHIAEMLLARGDHVIVIDNLATGRREHLNAQPNLEVIIDTKFFGSTSDNSHSCLNRLLHNIA